MIASPNARSSVIMLVQLEVRVDDLLDGVFDLLVERKPYVVSRIDPGTGVEGNIGVEPLYDLAEGHLVLGPEVEPEALVQLPVILTRRPTEP